MVATSLVASDKNASAIAIMFTGLTVATILGVPFGTWLGQHFGWRATFWAVTLVGVVAFAIIAALVPASKSAPEPFNLREDLAVLKRGPVLAGLLTTVLGWVGVFAVFTYLAPLLTKVTGFSDAAVSPVLLVVGIGLLVGNLLGGRFADKRLMPTVFGSLFALALVLALMTFVLHDKIAMVIFAGLFGVAAFATAPPLQMWVLDKAHGAGQSLASSFNIAAFNLGNAIGAWLGGLVIDHGPGLEAVPWIAALVPLAGLLLAIASHRLDMRQARLVPAGACPEAAE